MKLRHEETGNNGKFYMELEGNEMAFMTYRMNHNTLIVEHTVVDEALQGKNIGHQLVTAAADYARARHYTIKPLCSFARSVFKETPELNDVLER